MATLRLIEDGVLAWRAYSTTIAAFAASNRSVKPTPFDLGEFTALPGTPGTWAIDGFGTILIRATVADANQARSFTAIPAQTDFYVWIHGQWVSSAVGEVWAGLVATNGDLIYRKLCFRGTAEGYSGVRELFDGQPFALIGSGGAENIDNSFQYHHMISAGPGQAKSFTTKGNVALDAATAINRAAGFATIGLRTGSTTTDRFGLVGLAVCRNRFLRVLNVPAGWTVQVADGAGATYGTGSDLGSGVYGVDLTAVIPTAPDRVKILNGATVVATSIPDNGIWPGQTWKLPRFDGHKRSRCR